ncbi:flagellar motor protein MotB [Methylophaga lonarensis MPL]|uniref:Flagellar motor protein MotB n=1 Tax=Methylophaga lonarensis MPL TaxID=1286106 RepID=M7NU45_9GAMM|nr:OmpA family protein [Methylophaga lonarensis]EMR12268.1 flagellar motor protein MotB [Methylophaga lonarensis MPL]
MSEAAQETPRKQPDKKVIIIPRYIATMADLMTLLLCFFILLLSMSEIDIIKYRTMAASMADAFGVDAEIDPLEIPMSTSVISQTFSPNPTDDLPLDVRYQAVDPDQAHLRTDDVEVFMQAMRNQQVATLRELLQDEIAQGMLNIETREDRILVTLEDQASFPSGSAELKREIMPVLDVIAGTLSAIDGMFVVSGHTDNVPLAGGLYRSNWELSASRATSVVHELIERSALPENRFRIEGYGDTQPVAENNSPENRARNRRVEIAVTAF